MKIIQDSNADLFLQPKWMVYVPGTGLESCEHDSRAAATAYADAMNPNIVGEVWVVRVDHTIERVTGEEL